jgi:hypothetical protein
MNKGYYLLNFGFFLTWLLLMMIDIHKVIIEILVCIGKTNQFLRSPLIPKDSIYSYAVTSLFSVTVFLLGNYLLNYIKYKNEVDELKRIFYALIDDQILSIDAIYKALKNIKCLLNELYPILSGKEEIDNKDDRKKDLIRNLFSDILFLKRTIDEMKKNNLYEKLTIDRKIFKSQLSIPIDNYLYFLKGFLINLETFIVSNFPESMSLGSSQEFHWRNLDSLLGIMERAIVMPLEILKCKAMICKIILSDSKNVRENKESLVDCFYNLIRDEKTDKNFRVQFMEPNQFELIVEFIDSNYRDRNPRHNNFHQTVIASRNIINQLSTKL